MVRIYWSGPYLLNIRFLRRDHLGDFVDERDAEVACLSRGIDASDADGQRENWEQLHSVCESQTNT